VTYNSDREPKTISASELAGRLGAVLDEVERGARYEVTRRGKLVAFLEPPNGILSTIAREPAVSYPTAQALPDTALSRLVGAGATRKVLGVFLSAPATSLHQREIARRASVGLRSAQIALDRLQELGVIESERDGNRRNYRVVRTQRFEELRALLSREIGLAEILTRHLKHAGRAIAWAFVFGSAASQTDSLGSDIDVLVVGEATDDDLAIPLGEASREIGREIDLVTYRPAEFAEKRAAGNHFLAAILEQPRFDLIGSADDT
jgi:predicted nucleotidyltransferase/antitoxin (DNA-binding transcriptional repressor) of toxin-antitoxin stability system